MSSPLPSVLLLLLLLSGPRALCTPQPLLPLVLQETIRVARLLQEQASCDKTKVMNIFAGNKTDDKMELLCKAYTVTESQRCHELMQGLSTNLRRLMHRHGSHPQTHCPVTTGNTTSTKNFLKDLQKFLQQLAKENS